MRFSIKNLVAKLFFLLAFLVPLVFYPYTSELFEFNKMLLVYAGSALILFLWSLSWIATGKFTFKRSLLDIPLIIFISSQVLSTLISIDPRTSLLGYYSRFNGGLLSTFCYSILYWGYVSFVGAKNTKKFIAVALISTFLASIYAALEHFGNSPSCLLIIGKFDVSCWVQDVQNRVFGTFGQPNWIGTWLVALIPITWALLFKKFTAKNYRQFAIYFALFALFFVTLSFTKSRSAFLGFVFSLIVYWPTALYITRKKIKYFTGAALAVGAFLLLATFIIKTPWRDQITGKINDLNPVASESEAQATTGTVLEIGGTESGEIRKIVWKGAIDLWRAYPIFGSGVETFAYGYYQFRPMEHNVVSEWNYLYNKAHNEYLNYLATTGVLGLGSYLALIFVSIYLIFTKFRKNSDLLVLSLLSGYAAILVANFFGFSVVPVNLMFFLFPAIALGLNIKNKEKIEFEFAKLNQNKKITALVAALVLAFILYNIAKYFQADVLYAKSVNLQKQGELIESAKLAQSAVEMYPNEAVYREQIGSVYSQLALLAFQENLEKETSEFVNAASSHLSVIQKLAPRNVKLLKAASNSYSDLAQVDPNYLTNEYKLLEHLSEIAPTDAGIMYRYGLVNAKMGQTEKAIEILKLTIEAKPDYKLARRLLAFIYSQNDQKELAIEQLKYILEKISPDDTNIQQDLEDITSKQK